MTKIVICPVAERCVKENKRNCGHLIQHDADGHIGCMNDICGGDRIGPCIEYKPKEIPSPFRVEIVEVE
jgi:hypothetical protein